MNTNKMIANLEVAAKAELDAAYAAYRGGSSEFHYPWYSAALNAYYRVQNAARYSAKGQLDLALRELGFAQERFQSACCPSCRKLALSCNNVYRAAVDFGQ